MKKLAIIGANSFQNPLILRAKELGYETHVFAWKDGSIGEKTADYFYPISIIEKDEILKKCKELKIDAITTIASDLATTTVNYVAKNMGLCGNSLKCTQLSTNKYLMRKAFLDNHIETPKFYKISKIDEIDNQNDMKYPLIVKPTDRSGSRAITKAYNETELKEAILKAVDNSFEKKAIVEEYIDGPEFSIEGISYHGIHHFLTITRKSTTGEPHFIETGHIEPAGLSKDTVARIQKEVSKALDALEITDSASHTEFRLTKDGNVRIIEIGARMGGDCIGSDLVYISTGYDFVKMVIDVAFGNEPDFTRVRKPQIAIIRFIFNKKDYDNYMKVKRECPDLLYFESEIEDVGEHAVVDSSTRFGYYILACDNKDRIRWLLNDEEKYES